MREETAAPEPVSLKRDQFRADGTFIYSNSRRERQVQLKKHIFFNQCFQLLSVLGLKAANKHLPSAQEHPARLGDVGVKAGSKQADLTLKRRRRATNQTDGPRS